MSHRDRKLEIPPRWLHCPRKGTLIVDKFLPFKTPLDNKYDSQVPEECRFGINMLFSSMKSMKVKIGLWIDLTNTNRFYDSKTVEDKECRYVKIQCRGHGETPDQDSTQTFLSICERFIQQKPLEVIGVHCTHGFNRTGFLITSYLVEKMNWSVEAALKSFEVSRPPGIYKQDYLFELFTKFADKEDTPAAPDLPAWCTESDDTVDDDGNALVSNGLSEDGSRQDGSRKRRKTDYSRKEFMDGAVPGVKQVYDGAKLSNLRRKCQIFTGWKSDSFPGSQPVSMDIDNLGYLKKEPYKVSWKADGARYLMLIDGPNEVYMFDRDNTVFHVPGVPFFKRKNLDSHLENTLVDGEMILDEVQGKTVPRYLIYDIIKFDNLDVGKTDFDRRLLCIEKEIIGPRYTKSEKGLLDRTREPFRIRAKPFWDITVSRKLLDGHFSKEVSHEVDGLIFQPTQDKYLPGTCKKVMKWKPADMNSVDFKLQIQVVTGEGMLPQKAGFLYVGQFDKPFSQMKVTKEVKELNGKIVECSYDGKEWKFMRQRTDKSFPNSYKTAMSVCKSIQHPVTKDILFNVIEQERWMPEKSHSHQQPSSSRGSDHELMPPPKLPHI